MCGWMKTSISLQFNSFWSSDAIWRHRSGSTLTQVMACCLTVLTAPSHYLNQCWLVISEVPWHSPESKFRGAQAIGLHMKITLQKLLLPSPRGQWVKYGYYDMCDVSGRNIMHLEEFWPAWHNTGAAISSTQVSDLHLPPPGALQSRRASLQWT